jgi:hypothetical protein
LLKCPVTKTLKVRNMSQTYVPQYPTHGKVIPSLHSIRVQSRCHSTSAYGVSTLSAQVVPKRQPLGTSMEVMWFASSTATGGEGTS